MNENIDLTKILKDCPKGWKFYSSIYGDIIFDGIGPIQNYPIIFSLSLDNTYHISVTKQGQLYSKYVGECTVFPSKEQRDWSKFTAPWYNKPIEQKLKVGQYITDGHHSGQIIEDDCHCYKILDLTGCNATIIPFTLQDNYHFWTIQDAKDSDVLSFYSDYKGKKMFLIGIIEKYVGKLGGCYNIFKTYVGMDWDNNLHIGRYMGCDDIQPATKEQRDALMKAMNDAEYEWDIEKKELKKKRNR